MYISIHRGTHSEKYRQFFLFGSILVLRYVYNQVLYVRVLIPESTLCTVRDDDDDVVYLFLQIL